MSFRINPYKIMRLIIILAFLGYVMVEINDYNKEKKIKTNEITKQFTVRQNGFENSKDEKERQAKVKAEIEKQLEEDDAKVVEKTKENEKTNDTNNSENVTITNEGNNGEITTEEKNNLANEKTSKTSEIKSEDSKIKETTEKISAKRFIQVATVPSEKAAKDAVARLGSGFMVQKVAAPSGKTMYQVISISTNDTAKLKELEKKVKSKAGSGYIIRTVGK